MRNSILFVLLAFFVSCTASSDVAKIGNNLGEGGFGLNKAHRFKSDATLLELFSALRLELDDMQSKYNLLLKKLDNDIGVAGTDFESLVDYSDPKFVK